MMPLFPGTEFCQGASDRDALAAAATVRALEPYAVCITVAIIGRAELHAYLE